MSEKWQVRQAHGCQQQGQEPRQLSSSAAALCMHPPLHLACFLSSRRILHTLRVRYGLDSIYTYSGNILIAVSTVSKEQLQCIEL